MDENDRTWEVEANNRGIAVRVDAGDSFVPGHTLLGPNEAQAMAHELLRAAAVARRDPSGLFYPRRRYLGDEEMRVLLKLHGVDVTVRELRGKAGRHWDGGPGKNKWYEALWYYGVPSEQYDHAFDEPLLSFEDESRGIAVETAEYVVQMARAGLHS
jgi:hypothetical protein